MHEVGRILNFCWTEERRKRFLAMVTFFVWFNAQFLIPPTKVHHNPTLLFSVSYHIHRHSFARLAPDATSGLAHHPKRRFEAQESHFCMRNVGALNFVASISHSLIPSNVLIHTTLQLLLRLAIWLTVCFEEISIQTLLELTAALTLCSFNKHQNVNWCSKSDFLFVIQRCKCYAWFIVSHPSICGGVARRSGGQQGGRRDSRRLARWAPKTRP